jgi:dipeptidyl aminopeptidase/acylaminoacyl peptidase
MRRTTLALWIALFCSAISPTARAQGTRADYERAESLRQRLEGKVFKTRVTPHWDADGARFWYRNDLAGGQREFVRVDALRGVRGPAFDHPKLAAALAKALDKEVPATRLPIEQLVYTADNDAFRILVAGQWWQCDGKTYGLEKTSAPEEKPVVRPVPMGRGRRQPGPRRGGPEAPDGKWTALIKNANVFLRVRDGGAEVALSSDGKADDGYTGEFYWSPDSRRLVALRRHDFKAREIYLIESSPRDQLQPKLHTMSYRKPGDPVPITKPHLFNIEKFKEVPVADTLFPNPWEIGEVRWERDGKRFTFLYNQRGHQVLRLVGVDADSGQATALVDEQSKTFIDYAHKRYTNYLDDTHELIWMSERDGWNHLYLYDLKTGQVKNPITRGEWVVRGVDRVDAARRQVWFRAGGIHPEQDPYYIHYARVNFDGTGLVLFTEGDGTHSIEYSPDGRFLLDTYSRVDLPPIVELRRIEDGGLICLLERADASALRAAGRQTPEPFVAKGRDGKTDIYGVIFRPTNFDPARKYPVIENIYAGPQGSFAPKAFLPFYRHQALAELGFVVVQLDGMGTSNRSKAFHDVCCKNLVDAGFPDRILWMQAAARKYPCLDLTRVGVYGGSAGGQNALGAVLTHGEFYKAAAADCGCHDNRMDKVWWNELWMGWPVGPHYAEQSNVTLAHKLQGKLLLMVGELDRNVDPASTMQVVNALIKANKDFDLLVVPGGGHGAGSGPYGTRRQRDFFVRHLLGVEPRAQP